MSERNLQAVAEAIRAAERVCLVSHVNPDGDTLGSSLALRLGLERLGKRVQHFCQDKVPDNLLTLPNAEKVRRWESLAADERFDLLLPVDVSDRARLGTVDGQSAFELLLPRCGDSAQVDHHGTNDGYCAVNAIDGDAPAAGLLVRELLGLLGVALDADIAACLYAAISTDTGNFSYGNTNAEAFRVAAELVEAGLPLAEWNRRLFVEKPMAQQMLTAKAMASLRYLCNGRIGVMTLTQRDFTEAHALPEHADQLVNIGLQPVGAVMAFLAREAADGQIKCSLRALAPWRVDEVARCFGGGGHAQAAGCTVTGTLEDVTERVTAAMAKALTEE